MKCEMCIHYGICVVNSYCHEPCGYYEVEPHREWIECEDKRYCECSNCWVLVTKKEAEDFGDCPKCGSDNRPKEGE